MMTDDQYKPKNTDGARKQDLRLNQGAVRRQNNGEKLRLIQSYVQSITDERMRIACYMYMKNYKDRDIRKQLKISQHKLECLKLQLAFEMKKAGIRV